jgi:putative DNA methylase
MSDYPIYSPRKLVEVALPLDVISAAAAREKSIRYGHPSTLHLWWSRKPLAAARAVIFAQLVNDPGYQQNGGFKYGKNKKEAAIERKRLFKIMEDLVLWENTTNEEVLERARAEIRRSWLEVCELNKDHPQAPELFNAKILPAFFDPFAGGGSIPLEAQRLGVEAWASDLNPVAVLINKAMIEIPPKFAGQPPVGPLPPERNGARLDLPKSWTGVRGLAEDLRRYGAWMSVEAQKRVGHLYPPMEVTSAMAKERADLKPLVGQKLMVIAWLYCRTVASPNPAFANQHVPLATKFWLLSRAGNECYVLPVLEKKGFNFSVKTGKPSAENLDLIESGTQISRGSFRCIFSNTPISYSYIDDEANAGRMGSRLMAIVAEVGNRRVYFDPTPEAESAAQLAKPEWRPDTPTRGTWASNAQGRRYGFNTFGDYFTKRQLCALNTFSDLVFEVRQKILQDVISSGVLDDGRSLNNGGVLATAYADAIAVYLSFTLSKIANIGSAIASWMSDRGAFRETFARQGIAMAWDFVEANPFSDSGGSLSAAIDKCAMAIDAFPASPAGYSFQANAATQTYGNLKVISTDPPYYDNVGYADLSDFFYVWLRRSLRDIFPDIFASLASPKGEELVACSYRHGSKDKAEVFFMDGMSDAMRNLEQQSHPAFPVTIYYAFKQAETKRGNTSSTGWETFLEAVVKAGFALSGTWPMRTEGAGRIVAHEANSLASSILLVCRKRPADAPSISRREFIRELNGVLPVALDEMTKGSGDERSPVAPVDLSQAIIGPGMAVFSKYAAVLEADGSNMSVRTALQLINRFLAEDDFDADTQFCLHWFEQYGWKEGPFGEGDTLARGKGTSVDGVKEAGVIESGAGKVRLFKWAEYPTDWDPRTDKRTPIWEALHHLIRALKQGGESASGALLAALGGKAEAVRQLAYRLYTLCERLGQAEDARAYNELITSWTGIESAAAREIKPIAQQRKLFE